MDTAARRLRPAYAVASAALLLAVGACGSAQDLASDSSDDPTSTPSTTVPTTPPTTDPTTAPTTPAPTPAAATPKAGQCTAVDLYSLVTRVVRTPTRAVSCGASHTGQTYAVRSLSSAQRRAVTSGSTSAILTATRGYCESALTSWLRTDTSKLKRSQFDFVVGVPSSTDLAAGAKWLRCDLFVRNGLTKAVALPASTRAALKGSKGGRFLSCVKGNISTASGTVPCSSKHQWKGVSSIKLGSASKSFPGSGRVRSVMKSRCSGDVRSYLNTRGGFRYGYIVPTKTTWSRGDRYGVCFANTRK